MLKVRLESNNAGIGRPLGRTSENMLLSDHEPANGVRRYDGYVVFPPVTL